VKPTHDWYYSKIKQISVLDRPAQRFLIRRAQEGDLTARNLLVKHNLRLVIGVARRLNYVPGRIEFIDLIAEGNLGLFNAIRTFDLSRGTSFTTIAVYWIKQKIGRYIDDFKSMVQIPIYLSTFRKKYRELEAEFIDELGRPPSEEEAAMALQVNKSTLRSMELAEHQEVSCNLKVGEKEEGELQDLIAAVEPRVRFREDYISMVMDLLEGREKFVLARRVEGDLLKTIGDKLGVTRERVRQIEKKAIQHLKTRIIQATRGHIKIDPRKDFEEKAKTLLRAWCDGHNVKVNNARSNP
jgi:RNA polymerase sigma factor (sigma-70 family)